MPRYMERFRCIGPACEDTCCAWWGISVDRRAYERYRAIGDEHERRRILSKISLKTEGSDQNYASFEMNPATGNCSMLGDDGLCTIQARHGEAMLCATCATYPRKVNEEGGTLEISAALSCPEAARLALLREDACELIAVDEISTPNLSVNRPPAAARHMPHARAIRGSIIRLLQMRRYLFPHRLILLGLLCEELDRIAAAGDTAAIPAFLAEFEAKVGGGLADNPDLRDYAAFPRDTEFQIRMLNGYLMRKLEGTIWNLRYQRCMADYVSGMAKRGREAEQVIRHYEKTFAAHVAPFIGRFGHFFENYAVNQVYGTFLPGLRSGQRVGTLYRMLVVDYAMIKLHLTGIAAHRGGLTPETAIELVQCYTKNYEFVPEYRVDFLLELAAKGRDAFDDILLLITS
jgi:lysine-N-methylase